LPATKQLIVRSGTSGTAVNQTADRQVTIVCREYA
jgi:hypothetical protein